MLNTLLNILGLLWLLVIAGCGGGGQSLCGNAADGTSCASDGTCQSGICKRIVSGTFQTMSWTDDGTKTTVAGAPQILLGAGGLTADALLVPDASPGGYALFPLTLDANQSFSVPGVPVGPYFLEMSATRLLRASCGGGPTIVNAKVSLLFDLATSAPDLVTVTSGRPDLTTHSKPNTQVTFNITGMEPWAFGDRMQFTSAQGQTNQSGSFQITPATGAVSFSGTSQWFGPGLPDAAKNDVVFVYQRATIPIASGASAASLHRATRYARLTDLTVADGATSTASVGLVAAPQTGSVDADLRGAQFAAFAADVNPGAAPSFFGMLVFSVPHSVSYPDMPPNEGTPVLFLEPSSAVDANYGALAYGQFLDPFWKELRRVFYTFDVSSAGTQATLQSDVSASALTAGPIVPLLGPPRSPRVNGNDAFAAQTGVGVQPTISWSPPTRGAPTSYVIEIVPLLLPCNTAGQTVGVTAVVHGSNSFKVPPGVLKSGLAYRATITARQAPWDTLDAGPFRTGTPFHSAQCVTSTFVP
jgi:hypothetical protein